MAQELTCEDAHNDELEEVLRAHGVEAPRLYGPYEKDVQLCGVRCAPSAPRGCFLGPVDLQGSGRVSHCLVEQCCLQDPLNSVQPHGRPQAANRVASTRTLTASKSHST